MIIELSDHPLVRHHLTVLRDRETDGPDFRRAGGGITRVLIVEAARLLRLEPIAVTTPMEPTEGERIGEKVVFLPILRAGFGMLDAAMEIIPNASVGYIGLERDERTAQASCYYSKVPGLSGRHHVFVIDPMLATGGSAVQAIDQVKKLGAEKITMVTIISAPEGVAALRSAHSDISLITGKIDRELNADKFILPGLGDFGDRLFGT